MRIFWKCLLGLVVLVAVGSPFLPLFLSVKSFDKIRDWLPATTEAAGRVITAEPAKAAEPSKELDPAKAGQFGDFVGGFIGTIIFSLSVVILIFTYWNQKGTNERITFESRFFEFLKYHRENVGEIALKGKSGRRAFVSLIREFRMALKVVDSACRVLVPSYSQRRKIDLAYMAFYYGVGPNSTRVFEKAVNHDHPSLLIRSVIDKMSLAQKAYLKLKAKKKEPPSHYWNLQIACYELERITYGPFDGHQSRLAHYFRHLWQMMKYVDAHAPHGKTQEYAGIVRAQLSNHEQALLCLNSLSSIGAEWLGKKGLLTKYALIKNIPEAFFDGRKELRLKTEFPKIRFEFENSSSNSAGPNVDTLVADE